MEKNSISFSAKYLEDLIASNYLPLINNTFLDSINTNYVNNSVMEKIQNLSFELYEYPKFKNIKTENIICLRIMLQLGDDIIKVQNWCLNLLRYIEINLPNLKRNEKLYNRSTKESILIFQMIKALFVEYHIKSNDLIFLNTALKLNDLRWAKPTLNSPIPIKELCNIKNRQIEYILKELVNE